MDPLPWDHDKRDKAKQTKKERERKRERQKERNKETKKTSQRKGMGEETCLSLIRSKVKDSK